MKLKKYLRRNKITYRVFAQDLGIAEQSLRSIMAGQRRPGLDVCLKIEELTRGEITPSQIAEDFKRVSREKAEGKNSQECRQDERVSPEKNSMRLKEYLRKNKILYRTFAQDLGIAEQSLRSIMAGIRRPGLDLCLKIEKLTNGQITPSELVEDYKNASKEKLKNNV